MDETHLVAALRYVALNPVRARLTRRAEDWRWSSTRAHYAAKDDHVVTVAPAIERVGDFTAFLGEEFNDAMTYAALRKAESVGRPARSRKWLADMEARTGLTLSQASEAHDRSNLFRGYCTCHHNFRLSPHDGRLWRAEIQIYSGTRRMRIHYEIITRIWSSVFSAVPVTISMALVEQLGRQPTPPPFNTAVRR